MLDRDQERRPSAMECLKHKWLRDEYSIYLLEQEVLKEEEDELQAQENGV
jgi:hypothetical protein